MVAPLGIVASAYVVPTGGSFLTDDFNRADGVLTTPWFQNSGASNTLNIVSNQVAASLTGDGTTATAANNGQPGLQVFSQATFTAPTLTANGYFYVLVRSGLLGDSTQGFYIMRQVPNTTTIAIRRYDGSGLDLATGSNTIVAGTPQTWRLEITSGGVLTGKVNGTTVLTANDSAYSGNLTDAAHRYVGLGVRGNCVADNWSGGTF